MGALLSMPHLLECFLYNPHETLFLKNAEAAGLQVASGLGMLIEQAALSFACWTGQRVPRSVLESALEEK